MNRITLAFAIAATLAAATAQSQTYTAPSSSQTPYLVPTAPGVETHSILTAGDSVNNRPDGTPYRMAGIPDGLGAFDNHDGTFTVLMNHEIPAGSSIVRAHGGTGAFVSKWIVNKDSFQVVRGDDLIQHAYGWSGTQWVPLTGSALNFARFCSADLPDVSAFFDRETGRGTQERIFMNGEESGVEGRAFAHVVTGDFAGKTYDLPWLGRFSWENSVAKPRTGARTVLVGLDDGTGGQVYVYVGDKTNAANPVEAAGLTNGKLYGIKIGAGAFVETNSTVVADGTRFSLQEIGDVSKLTGAQLETLSGSKQVANMARPEDGSWDPTNPAAFYFATTASFNGISRVWKLEFDNAADVLQGGTVRVVTQSPAYDAANPAGPRMLDNLTVSRKGKVIAQEDVGNQPYIGSVWQIDPVSGTTVKLAQHDPARFTPGAPGFLTQDEESSGVIQLKGILGESWFLIDVQSHRALGADLYEDGQLLAIKIPQRKNDKREKEDESERPGKD